MNNQLGFAIQLVVATILNLSYAHTCNNISSPAISEDCTLLATMKSMQHPKSMYQLGQNCLKTEETYDVSMRLTCH